MMRWGPFFVVAVFAVAFVACGSSDGGREELECEIKGYPCSLGDVPEEILQRSDSLSDEALDRFAAGASTAEVEAWLAGLDGMAEVESDAQALRFRLDGGRGTWVLREGAFGTRSAPGSGSPGGLLLRPTSSVFPHVVGPESDEKSAIVLSPFLWDFGSTDEGPLVDSILSGTRGYEGRVRFLANAAETATEVNIASFTGWDEFDVVHVVSHGTRICKNQPCRAAISAGTLQGLLPGAPGVTTLQPLFRDNLNQRGLELGKADRPRGLEPEPGPDLPPGTRRITIVMLTAEFFLDAYDQGLTDTLIFFNACEVFGREATDLDDALRGDSNVFLGWDENVDTSAAFDAAVALYQDLAEQGYPVDVAYERLEGLRTDTTSNPTANLILGDRHDGDGLRIRDVVELLEPGSDDVLSPSSVIPIVGTEGDGEPDFVPWAVRVDGMTPEFAPKVILHVSVNGEEIDPQPISNGQVDDKDRWVITGEAPLGFDLEEDTTVAFRAWVELHSGGESDDESTATVTGGMPLMGLVWEMEATSLLGGSVSESSSFPGIFVQMSLLRVSTATLTLEFEPGQAFDEPHPRYVVTGGTVTYGDRNGELHGCTYAGGGLTYGVTPEQSPSVRDDGFAPSVLIFDTTVSPVEYHGVIYTEGPDDAVLQTCPESGAHTVSYGGIKTWMIVDQHEHRSVTDRTHIAESIEYAAEQTLEFTLTRVK